MLSTPEKKFDFEIDYDAHQRWAEHVERVLTSPDVAPGAVATLFCWGHDHQGDLNYWCQIQDPFGKMIRGVDWPLELNQSYDLDHVHCPYHPGVDIPCRIRVLKVATHEDAEAIHHGPLPRRKFYYEVMSD